MQTMVRGERRIERINRSNQYRNRMENGREKSGREDGGRNRERERAERGESRLLGRPLDSDSDC